MSKCIECGKELTNKWQKKFCCLSCSAKYNNRLRTNKDKNIKKQVICKYCGEEIEVNFHTSKKYYICENCRKNRSKIHEKQLNENSSILDVSKRTAVKILKRMGAGCAICGWNKSTCDIHHIIPQKEHGTNDNSNLVYICPNCHRLCHTTNEYSREYLKTLSIDKLYPNWRKFYHPSN